MTMKVVYMGTPDFAVPALERIYEAGHNIAAVVTRADARRDRGKKIVFSPVKAKAMELDIPILQPDKVRGNSEFIEEIREIDPDVIVVAAYGRILPKEILDIPRFGCINIHGSLLPRFRGAAPIQAAVLEGDEETGITIMKMDEGLDTGDMLLKRSTPIGEKTAGQLHDELAVMGADLIAETLEHIDELEPEKQDEDLATYAPMISKEDGKIDFSKKPEEIERQMRAFDPWPGTTAVLGDDTIKLWRGRVPGEKTGEADGTITSLGKDGIDVACGGGILTITQLQKPGKKRVSAGEYLRGNTIEIGSVLG